MQCDDIRIRNFPVGAAGHDLEEVAVRRNRRCWQRAELQASQSLGLDLIVHSVDLNVYCVVLCAASGLLFIELSGS